MNKEKFQSTVKQMRLSLARTLTDQFTCQNRQNIVDLFQQFDPILAEKYQAIEHASKELLQYIDSKLKG